MEADAAKSLPRSTLQSRRRACIELVDVILACPRFDMTAAYESEVNPMIASLDWPDETMLIRVLRCETLDARVLRADSDGSCVLHLPLLHNVINLPKKPYALPFIKELLKIGEMRDQVATISNKFVAIHIYRSVFDLATNSRRRCTMQCVRVETISSNFSSNRRRTLLCRSACSSTRPPRDARRECWPKP